MKSVSIIPYKREANRKGGKNQKWIKNPTMKKATTIPNRVDIDEAAIYLVHVPKCNQVNHKGREDSDCTGYKKNITGREAYGFMLVHNKEQYTS